MGRKLVVWEQVVWNFSDPKLFHFFCCLMIRIISSSPLPSPSSSPITVTCLTTLWAFIVLHMSISIVNTQTKDHTVDGSEIPRPTTERMYIKNLVNNGDKRPSSTGEFAGFQNHQLPRSMEQLYCAIRPTLCMESIQNWVFP